MSVVCFIDLSRDAHQKLEKTRRIQAAKSADLEYWAFCVDLHTVHAARASCEDAAQKMETMVPSQKEHIQQQCEDDLDRLEYPTRTRAKKQKKTK
jgi:predicted RNase H-like HicB family nuclease